MWQLITESATHRKYQNTITGSEISTTLLRVDANGNSWWGFDNLMDIPWQRKLATNTLSQLYGAGLTESDIKAFTANLKAILRSNDADKYERAYAQVIRLEEIANNQLNPLKQELGLCSVYVLAHDEKIDYYDSNATAAKIDQWTLDPETAVFFLEWFTSGMMRYKTAYTETTETVSKAKELRKKLASLSE